MYLWEYCISWCPSVLFCQAESETSGLVSPIGASGYPFSLAGVDILEQDMIQQLLENGGIEEHITGQQFVVSVLRVAQFRISIMSTTTKPNGML